VELTETQRVALVRVKTAHTCLVVVSVVSGVRTSSSGSLQILLAFVAYLVGGLLEVFFVPRGGEVAPPREMVVQLCKVGAWVLGTFSNFALLGMAQGVWKE
jgi:hypothetical protein